MSGTERIERHFIRHPAGIPLDCNREGTAEIRKECMRDISLGGIAFFSQVHFDAGDQLQVCYPLVGPNMCLRGEVIWCDDSEDMFQKGYACGLRFRTGEMLFRARLVEQICHIEAYRRAQAKLGRTLTAQDAALEWIPMVAHRFAPQSDV
jgi:hypothetical protein